MLAFFTDEPVIQTISNDSSGFGTYEVREVTGMQDDTVLASVSRYSTDVYVPDGNEDVEIGSLLRTMIETQERNISTLQGWNSQSMGLTQSTFAFNSYFSIVDSSNVTDYSIIYDTRGKTAEEAGCTYYYQPYYPYAANHFPDREITHGQYISIMWRHPSNREQMNTYTLGREYVYHDSTTGLDVQDSSVIDPSITGQSFRYSGMADWQDWCDGNYAIKARFYIENEKHVKTYITPWLTPKWCEDPETAYLYWVNELGGIDFVRVKYVRTVSHEESTYENNIGINERRRFAKDMYTQKKWYTYTLNTSLVTDSDSPALASICGARWAWLYFPDEVEPWRSITITNSSAKVKTFGNQGHKMYNYTFEAEDNIKAKTV